MAASVFVGCRSMNETPNAAPQNETAPVAAPLPTAEKRPAMRFPPRLEAALKKSITARLNSWKASIEARDIEKHLSHYAERIENYYNAASVNREFVRADRARAFASFDTLELEIINVEIILEANDAATLTFDKSWDFRKASGFSNGLVQQEIRMRKIEKQWLITSERDLQVYRVHNQ